MPPVALPLVAKVSVLEPPTAAQESYLATLAREAGEEPPEGLTKAEASKRIDQLQEETGRGQ